MNGGPPSSSTAGRGAVWSDLPWELLADISGRLRFTDRLAFTVVFGDRFKPEAPCLVLPNHAPRSYKTTFFSLTDGRADTVHVRLLRDYGGHTLLGSSGGWLAMADNEACMHLINPATGQRHALPEITTMVGLNVTSFWDDSNSRKCFRFDRVDIRSGRRRPYHDLWRRTYTWSPKTDRVYRKMVLSTSARPGRYAAMLILNWGSCRVPAFATAEDPVWRLAPLRDDVVDAVHLGGRFYSLSRFGVVEAWDEEELTSEVVTSRLPGESDPQIVWKQLAATPDGRLIVVFWEVVRLLDPPWSRRSFKVQILDEASGSWQETDDIGQSAVLVGSANHIMCVSTREHQDLSGNCVYFTDQHTREVALYSLQHRTVRKTHNLGKAEGQWKAAAWFTPSIRD